MPTTKKHIDLVYEVNRKMLEKWYRFVKGDLMYSTEQVIIVDGGLTVPRLEFQWLLIAELKKSGSSILVSRKIFPDKCKLKN